MNIILVSGASGCAKTITLDWRHWVTGSVAFLVVVADSANRLFLPTLLPIVGGWFSSNFGFRIDPFSGMRSMHEGINFPAEPGTPIVAAKSVSRGGVVTISVNRKCE